jgi:hypothetical protein
MPSVSICQHSRYLYGPNSDRNSVNNFPCCLISTLINELRLARYYQPNPAAPAPFTVVPTLNDPDFATSCADKTGYCASAWGLRILISHNILVYGAGLYSFFSDYSTSKLTHIHYKYIQKTNEADIETS